MICAVLDTNVLLQAVIGSAQAASARTLRAYRDGRFRLAFSLPTLEELHAVLSLPAMQNRHQWDDEQIRKHFNFLLANADFYPVTEPVSAVLARDVTDTKFLELAQQSQARYLATNDRRHLLRLKHFHQTQIVTPAEFLRRLT
ncbi:MAG: putative toxin-antitoxin system toxin component, PIN family [Pirellulales bacterium]